MKRTIENRGEYLEVDVSEAVTRLEDMNEADVVVLTSARIELAGKDKEILVAGLEELLRDPNFNSATENFDYAQLADYLVRYMLLAGAYEAVARKLERENVPDPDQADTESV